MKQLFQALFEDRSPSSRLFVFLFFMGIGLMLAGGIVTAVQMLVPELSFDTLEGLLFGAVIQHGIVFIIPAILALNFYPDAGLFKADKVNWMLLLLSIPVMYLASPMVDLTSHLNGLLDLSKISASLAEAVEKQQQATTSTYEMFSGATSGPMMILTFLIIAILPAVSEELFFRAGLQRLIVDWVKRPHLGIWLSACLFSAIHMQPLDFLPRVLLGGLLGYMFYWSGSLWLPILAHTINNGLALISVWFFGQELSHAMDGSEMAGTWEIVLFTAMLLVNLALLYLAVQRHKNSNAGASDPDGLTSN